MSSTFIKYGTLISVGFVTCKCLEKSDISFEQELTDFTNRVTEPIQQAKSSINFNSFLPFFAVIDE